jgi:hypothetical protein
LKFAQLSQLGCQGLANNREGSLGKSLGWFTFSDTVIDGSIARSKESAPLAVLFFVHA